MDATPESSREYINPEELFSWKDLVNKFPEVERDFDVLAPHVLLYVRRKLRNQNMRDIKLDDLAVVHDAFDGDTDAQKDIYYSYTDPVDGEIDDSEPVNRDARFFSIGIAIIELTTLDNITLE